MAKRTFYEILGIPYDADDDEIRRAYRSVMQEHHPDQNPNDQRAARRTRYLNAAKDALLDQEKRKRYDRKLRRKGILTTLEHDQDASESGDPKDKQNHRKQRLLLTGTTEAVPADDSSVTNETETSESLAERWIANRAKPKRWIPRPHIKPISPKTRRLFKLSLIMLVIMAMLWGAFKFAAPAVITAFQKTQAPIKNNDAKSKPNGNSVADVDTKNMFGTPIPRQLSAKTTDNSETSISDSPKPASGLVPSQSNQKEREQTPGARKSANPSEQSNAKHSKPKLAPAIAVSPFSADESTLLQQQWSEYLGQPIQQTNSLGMTFQLIPPGRYLSGYLEQANVKQPDPSLPCIKIVEQPFYISQQPVTREQWKRVMNTEPWGNKEQNDSSIDPIANWVTWPAAQEFCKKLSAIDGNVYRLPSQSEWEHSWRAGKPNSFYKTDLTWDQTGSLNRTETHRFGLNFQPRLWEFCLGSFDNKNHLAQRPMVFDSVPIGHRLARGSAIAASNRSFRVLLDPLSETLEENHAPLARPIIPLSKPPAPPLTKSWTHSQDAEIRNPIPSLTSRIESFDEMQSEFGSLRLLNPGQAKTQAKMKTLAYGLLKSASTETDADRRFTLIDRSRMLYRHAGNNALADYCIDLLSEDYQTNALSMHVNAIRQRAKLFPLLSQKSKDSLRKPLTIDIKNVSQRAAKENRFEDQIGLLELYRDLLPANHKDLKATAQWLLEAREKSALHKKMMVLRENLILDSQPERETEVGKYLCFEMNQWSEGIPYLARGTPGTLREVAQLELDQYDSPEARLLTAEKWWALAESYPNPTKKTMQQRATQWYRSCYHALEGNDKREATRRLKEFSSETNQWNYRFQPGSLPSNLIQRGNVLTRSTGIVLQPNSAIALDTIFSSLESITIRGRIGSMGLSGKNNFGLQAGPVHAIFNWDIQPVNHFRTFNGEGWKKGGKIPPIVKTSPLLKPGTIHEIRLIKGGSSEIRLLVDGRLAYSSQGEFAGGIMIHSLGDPIEIESIEIRGRIDPFLIPDFDNRYDLQILTPIPLRQHEQKN